MQYAFYMLPETSKLCKYFVDLHTYRYDPSRETPAQVMSVKADLAAMPPTVLVDLYVARCGIQGSKKAMAPFRQDFCKHYHDHAEEEERQTCAKHKKPTEA